LKNEEILNLTIYTSQHELPVEAEEKDKIEDLTVQIWQEFSKKEITA
jgi:hypothetical protein